MGPPALWRDGRTLDPGAPVAAVLRDGDKVTLDPASPARPSSRSQAEVAEVRVVGGPAAGAVHRLGLGVHVIGSGPMCAIAAGDPALAPEAVTVRVTPEAITVERTWLPPGEAPQTQAQGTLGRRGRRAHRAHGRARGGRVRGPATARPRARRPPAHRAGRMA